MKEIYLSKWKRILPEDIRLLDEYPNVSVRGRLPPSTALVREVSEDPQIVIVQERKTLLLKMLCALLAGPG